MYVYLKFFFQMYNSQLKLLNEHIKSFLQNLALPQIGAKWAVEIARS